MITIAKISAVRSSGVRCLSRAAPIRVNTVLFVCICCRGRVLGLIFAAPIFCCPYFVASYSPHLSHFWFIVRDTNLIVKLMKQQNSKLFSQDHFESLITRIFLPQISENVRPHSGNY